MWAGLINRIGLKTNATHLRGRLPTITHRRALFVRRTTFASKNFIIGAHIYIIVLVNSSESSS